MGAQNVILKVAIIIPLFLSKLCLAQPSTTAGATMDDSGKHEFIQQAKKDTPDYSTAFNILTRQVKQHPGNAEYRYFLAYTIDRMHAVDARDMDHLQIGMTIEASEQLEEVNRLEPLYRGELFLSDPYSKLTSIWGSLALAYLNRKERDSANWALREGKRRGGFIDAVLSFNRRLLNSCEQNAILITRGDNITFSTAYLQLIENYRSDITIVNADMFNTHWYPKYMKADHHLKLRYTEAELDTISYREWQSRQIAIRNPTTPSQKFSWQLDPTYGDEYLLRSDIILLDMIEQNLFTRPIYFNNNSDSTYNLFLSGCLQDEGLVNKLSTGKIDGTVISKNLDHYNMEGIQKDDITKSTDALNMVNGFRWTYINNIYRLWTLEQYDKARELFKRMNEKFKREELPYASAEMEKYFTDFSKFLNKE